MDVQSAANLNIPEGSVRNIHDKDKRLLWSAVGYNVRYDGNTTQQTYTGKNLLHIPSGDYTSNGIIWSRSGNSVNGSGSFSGQTWSVFINSVTLSSPLPAATYTLSIKDPIPSPYRLEFSAWDENNVRLTYAILSGRTYVTFTRSSSIVRISVGIAGGTIGASVSLNISDIQLEASSSPTSFEPYVGGIPAPNPDYPQDVNVVKGEQTVVINGKNFFLLPASGTRNNVTYTKNSNGSISMSSNNASAKTDFVPDYFPVPDIGNPGDNVTITISTSKPLPTGMNLYISGFNNMSSNAWVQDIGQFVGNGVKTSESKTVTLKPGITRLRTVARANLGSTFNIDNVFVQAEIGSLATTFEQYQSKTVNFDLRGKNLFDNIKSEAYISKASLQTIPNGIRAITTTSSTDVAFAVMIVGKVEDFLGDKITLSYSSAVSSSSNTARAYIGLCDANGNNRSAKTYISATENGVGTYNIGNTIDSTRPYLCLAFYSATTTTTVDDYVDYNNVQLEIGDAATTYQPYHAPIELCKIGNYQDYIYKGADGWYVHKETGKTILDGDEAVTASATQTTGRNRFIVDGPNDMKTNTELDKTGLLLSNKFIEIINYYSLIGAIQGMFVRANGSKQFIVNYYGVTTATAFKTWLSTNNVTVYYALATPTNTKITDTTITSQLDAIHDWLTRYDYYGNVTGNLPMIINRTGLT